ncbi:MAG: HlyD family efflux transporter periplasmic adaptor subunit [Cyanobacteria bacterium CYA]|nr:MAG: HlyD family efflux transporter periplasmic adaptor subunit [Cyanobacteria bacterium CYA]
MNPTGSRTTRDLAPAGGARANGRRTWVTTHRGGNADHTPASGKATATADIVESERGTFEIRTLATGELEAKNRIDVRNRLDKQATIIEIIPEGTFVQAGDVLVRLNADAIEDSIVTEELALDEAKAELLAAETAYSIQQSENDSLLRAADLKVRLAELALKEWAEGDDVRQMEELRLAIDQAQREVTRLTEKHERNKELLDKKFISNDQYQQDEMAKEKADANLLIANLNLKVYESYTRLKEKEQKESDVAEAKAELTRTVQENEINLTSRLATVSNRQRQVQRREDRLTELRQQFDYCTLLAPSSGLVVYGTTIQSDNFRFGNEGAFQVGSEVRPNDLLIVLPDTSQMVARVKVHESLAGRVRPGQPAEVQIDAAGKHTFSGTVESIGVMAESAGWRDPNRREYSVRITLDPGQETGDLKPSMRCEARIQLGVVSDVVHVPVQAVFIEGPVTYVYTPRAGKFARVPVQLGRRSETRAELLAGASAGLPVLLRAPTPGEILAEPWKPDELKAAGYALDEDGNPVAPVMAQQGRAHMPGPGPNSAARPGRPAAGDASGAPKAPSADDAEENVAHEAKPADSDEAPADAADATQPAPAANQNAQPGPGPRSGGEGRSPRRGQG